MLMIQSNIAMIGLGVMGKSLALNLLDNGFNVTGFDINQQNRERANEEGEQLSTQPSKGRLHIVENLTDLLESLESPRVIALSVPAGEIVDSVIEDLRNAGLSREDIVIDTGNSLWTDSERREQQFSGQLRFFSTAVSGGEVGARTGPSLMASGDREAWNYVKPMWEAIAAKVDAKGLPVAQFESGEACAAYLGRAGAGHYVKMVHNGIEYADMQLICEAYHFMSSALNMPSHEIGDVFEMWNQGVLNSYLMEISADILRTDDPVTGRPFVEVVLDKAGQKGTGLWTAVNALQQGAPAPTIAQAVFSRAQSSQKEIRGLASSAFKPEPNSDTELDKASLLAELHDALYCSKLTVYAQGFDLLKTTSDKEEWALDFANIAKIWRAGCIIRAIFLQDITHAYQENKQLENLLLDPKFVEQLNNRSLGWRGCIAKAALTGVPVPAMSSALSYFDGLRSAVVPANLLQAQRDYFGSHSYARIDEPEEARYHLTWSSEQKQQISV
ncbi:NADP-dependent phosphogluconate dehydrogenase [Vibrio europaeus]|uniref:NADP-dependent phosphogluconate dehydrogenase n=1 Tax=Vibrio europaeus TaxID=300876 RepID=UPI00233EC7DA|nr:NADP-dependent phosphogluconate dehydrogenase [Vibrio europaeus]MDC5841927.1 NADP-dependent phosphogluconate dehydrogenase [Vibrio europaeus]MDC5855284.1 NADP-dependent phosphogluconate dehydrogenase [Vibrio europaeus]